MCKKTRTFLRRNDIEEKIKNVFCFVNLMYDATYFLGSIKLLDGCCTQSGERDPGGTLKGSFSRILER
jgi:hypothetical protein